MASRLTQAGAALQKVADAAKPLYASLDESQKRIFGFLAHEMMTMGHGPGEWGLKAAITATTRRKAGRAGRRNNSLRTPSASRPERRGRLAFGRVSFFVRRPEQAHRRPLKAARPRRPGHSRQQLFRLPNRK
jgi:hypothetical protein